MPAPHHDAALGHRPDAERDARHQCSASGSVSRAASGRRRRSRPPPPRPSRPRSARRGCGQAREGIAREVPRRVPQLRADHRLAALEEHLPHLHQQAGGGHLAVGHQGFEQGRIPRQGGRAVHPQGLVDPRHEEDQPEPRVVEQVDERVDPVVAARSGITRVRSSGVARSRGRRRGGLASTLGCIRLLSPQERREGDEPRRRRRGGPAPCGRRAVPRRRTARADPLPHQTRGKLAFAASIGTSSARGTNSRGGGRNVKARPGSPPGGAGGSRSDVMLQPLSAGLA